MLKNKKAILNFMFRKQFSSKQHKICFVNATRYDWDRKMNYSEIQQFYQTQLFYDELGKDPTNQQYLERIENCSIIVNKEIPISQTLINELPSSVKLICEAGTGYNNIAIDIAKQKNIQVCNIPSYSSEAVANLVINFILNFSCSMLPQHQKLWQGDRSCFTISMTLPHFELKGKTLGLIGGNGSIGQKVAQIASIMGMKIIISSRSPKTESQYVYTDSVDELLRVSDFVSIHCPLNQQTKHLINDDRLKLMKPTAYLINTSRGSIVDENALIKALKLKIIAGAALDVQEVEPPHNDSLLYSLKDNLQLTPHIGWKRLETRQRLINMLYQNIHHFIQGNPINIIN